VLLSIPLNVLTERQDSGYLRYLLLTMFLFILPGNVTGGEAETGLVYIPVMMLMGIERTVEGTSA
jgi:hypothetical protein